MTNTTRDSGHVYELNSKTLKESDHLSESNKKQIRRYCNKLHSRGIDKQTVSTRISRFHSIFKLVAPSDFELNSATQTDLEELVAGINKLENHSPRTIADYRTVIKNFYKVMSEGGTYPDKVEFIDGSYDNDEIDGKEPLDKSTIQEIIDSCKNDRDRAMYKLLYEGGLRPGELMSLKRKDIKFLDKGVRVKVPPVKTGERTILVVESERYLKDWIRKHPRSDNMNAPLWTKIRNTENMSLDEISLGYDHMRLKLKDISKRLDILTYQGYERTKHKEPKRDEEGNKIPVKRTNVVPYTFRHSRATHLATEITEATMKEYFGWKQHSDMPQVYIHLSGKDIDREIMKMYGIEEEEEKHEKRECGRCNKKYKGAENFCPRCGKPFDYSSGISKGELKESGKEIANERIEGLSEKELEEVVEKVVSKIS